MLNNLLAEPWLGLSAIARVLFFLLAWTVIWLPFAIVLARVLNWQINYPLPTEQKLPLLASLYLISPVIIGVVIKIEQNSWANFGLKLDRENFLWFGGGLLLAILGLGVLLGLEKILNCLKWQRQNLSNFLKIIGPLLVLSIYVSLVEELVFRGLILSELTINYNYWVASAFSSLIFALLHLVWEWEKTLPQLPGLWLMGMVLSQARLTAGGSLGLAIGLHAGWIWVLASVNTAELITYTENASPWLIGFGKEPLAGLIGIGLILATGVICYSAMGY